MNLLANPPFNDSVTVQSACAYLQIEAKMQIVSEVKDHIPSRCQTVGAKHSKLRSFRVFTSTFEIHPSNFASFHIRNSTFDIPSVPVCLWFSGKNNTLDSANDARLFDGETELSLVA